MYIINKKTNQLTKVEETSFKNEGFKERKNLQEWVVKNPEVLGEELLIIQKEFAGFDETKERLDLLALDKNGNLVIIENKLDDSGKDVVWQVLKYASYCSSLTGSEIIKMFEEYLKDIASLERPEDILLDFFNNDEDYEKRLNKNNQRIMMVSADFRKEVTSTVLWLLNNYNLKIQCFKVSISKLMDDLLFDIEQIIPTKDASEYQIKIAKKKQDESLQEEHLANCHKKREAFWTQFINEMNQSNNLCANLSPSRDTWISIATGYSGVSLNLVITQKHVGSEIYINKGTLEQNKKVFDFLFKSKDKIEKDFGEPLTWERRDNLITSKIAIQRTDLNAFDEYLWPSINKFLIASATKMHKAFKNPIADLRSHMNN